MALDFHENIDLAITLLGRVRRAYLTPVLRKRGFPPPMFDILMCINDHPGASQDLVADATCLDKATVARDACRLESDGYLMRVNSFIDRRQYELYLTDEGEKLAESALGDLRAWSDRLTAGLTDEEKRQLLDLLKRMAENLE